MKLQVIFCIIGCVTVASMARAQNTGPVVYSHVEPHHDPTFEGNVIRTWGLARFYSGWGDLLRANALLVSQQAVAARNENHYRYVMARRELQAAYRAAQEERRAKSMEARPVTTAFVPTVHSEHVNPEGSIQWVEVLLEPGTSDVRARIDDWFRRRASSAEMTRASCQTMLRDCQEVIRTLIDRKRNNEIDTNAFAAGFNCVEGLKREIRITQARYVVR